MLATERKDNSHYPAARERSRNTKSGFTVIELLVVLAVLAILAALAAPSLRDFVNEQRLASTMGQLVNDLNFARAEAIKRNARVLLCARVSQGTTCANRPEWRNGWLVCFDANGDDACDATAADDPNPVKLANPLDAKLTLAGGSGLVRFNPIGSSSGASTLTLTGTWTNSSTRIGTVAPSGSVTVRKN